VADTLGAPVIKTLPGKMVLPDDSPYVTGGLGLLGTAPSEELVEDADTLLMLGTNCPYTKHLPAPGKARVVQVELDPVRAGTRLPVEVPLIGDVGATLEALLPRLRRRTHRSHLERYQSMVHDWNAQLAALESPTREPIAPQYLAHQLDRLATDDAVLTCDSGTVATWAARHWHIRGRRELYLSGNLATMACGLPYAIGIQHAFPQRQVICFIGDGGFAMLMAEFLTAIRHKLPVKVVINNNNSLGQILWEQMILGYPEHGVRYPEPFVDYTALASANGALGIKVDRPDGVRTALERALGHDGPALVDVNVNPDEPPLPGKVEYQQAKKFAEAFLRGQPRKSTLATTLFRDKIEQLKG
jgi:pyruvate dehydrogenase (quinone)